MTMRLGSRQPACRFGSFKPDELVATMASRFITPSIWRRALVPSGVERLLGIEPFGDALLNEIRRGNSLCESPADADVGFS